MPNDQQLSSDQGLNLLLLKKTCSWMDNSALKRCILSDNYLLSKSSPSGCYIYFAYTYEIVVFNTFCGTQMEFPMAFAITSFIPIDDTSAYLIQIESNNRLYAREVFFNFSMGYIEEKSKHLLITDCDKFQNSDSITYQKSTSTFLIIYRDMNSTTNFRSFEVGSWKETTSHVEQFGNGLYSRFPCMYNNHVFSFPNRKVTTIKKAAKKFGFICEVNPKIASTIPVAPVPRVRPPAGANRMLFIQQIQALAVRLNFPALHQNHPIQQIIPPAHRVEPQEDILPRHRIIPLINDLRCVGIPEEIQNLENTVEKFESQWVGERFYLLWSIGLGNDCPEGTYQQKATHADLFHGFINFFAIFNIKNMTWYPIKINQLSLWTDSPLLFSITNDDFLTLFISQLSQPYKWNRTRPIEQQSSNEQSILSIDNKSSFQSMVYRVPLEMFPDWNLSSHDELQSKYGKLIAYDHRFYNESDALMELYIFIRQLKAPKRRLI